VKQADVTHSRIRS